MNPYFRGWHLPYTESTNCDRSYSSMYPASWTSGYFTPPSMYPFQTDGSSVKQANSGDWKINPINSAETANVPRDSNLMKSGYESIFYKTATSNARSDFEACARDDSQRSCCAISCSCSNHQRLNVLDNTWRSSEMSPNLDFKNTPSISPYQSLCQRGKVCVLYVQSLTKASC